MENKNNKYLEIDMATVAKSIRVFSGENGEDVETWLKHVNILSQGAGLSDNALLGLIIIKLTGAAQTYLISLSNGNLANINLETLILGLKKRFGNQSNTDEILERFLVTKTSLSYEEYTKLLKEATTLYERECISLKSLIRMTISKSPLELKTLLYQYACTATDWNSFVQQAEEAAWMAFPERINNRIASAETQKVQPKQGNKKKNFGKNLHCIIHKNGNHSTENCYYVKQLEENGWKKYRTSNAVEKEDTPSNSLEQ